MNDEQRVKQKDGDRRMIIGWPEGSEKGGWRKSSGLRIERLK